MMYVLIRKITEFICGSAKRSDSLEDLNMDTSCPETTWDVHYYEASVYLKEGKNNDRFTIDPRDPARHFAYKVVHSTWFHLLNLIAPICLLLLTISEPPSLHFIHIPLWVHGIIELSMLLVIAIELVMKLNWLGTKHFLSHTRTLLKLILFCVMFSEAIVLIVRQTNHFRVTRALRPLFLLDSFYCRNIRRFIRQLLQSLAAMFNVFLLLISFMLIFAILGFFLFSNNPADTYFQSISDSFISLFILMTTANFPDVMLPSFKKSKWSAVFFIIYISIELFIFMNMFLAVVYSAFIKTEKDKFKKLYLHKRNGCVLAYRLLSNECTDGIAFKHFRGCMGYYKPRMDSMEVYLLFKSLDINDSGKLSLNEFMAVFDNIKLRWEKEKIIDAESMTFPLKAKSCLFKLISNKWFNNSINVIILLNFLWILFDSIRLSIMKYQSAQETFDWSLEEAKFSWVTALFVLIYVVEASLKMSGFGFSKYFSNGWNIFDFLVTLTSLVGVVVQLASGNMFCIMVVRPLRVLRLFKVKSSLRHVFDSLFMLVSRICSLAVVMLLLLYFFAIIGMEIFAPYSENLKNCCLNTSVQQYYVYNNGSGPDGYYYLCTFENILDSGVTLFELTVVNNWWIIMEGYAYVVSPWTRIFFMLFYLVTMVVMAVVVAFILEAYLFREQCREDYDGHKYQRILVSISPQELAELESGGDPSSAALKEMESPSSITFYEGTRRLEKDDFSLKMYSSEVRSWITESLS